MEQHSLSSVWQALKEGHALHGWSHLKLGRSQFVKRVDDGALWGRRPGEDWAALSDNHTQSVADEQRLKA